MLKHLRKPILCAVSIFILLSAAGCTEEGSPLTVPEYVPKKTTYVTEVIQRQSIEEKSVIYGSVAPLRSDELGFDNVEGYLKKFHSNPGTEVKKGEPIAELESYGLETQIRDQKFRLDKARLYYEKCLNEYNVTGKGKDTLEIAGIDLQIEQYQYDKLVKRLESLVLYAPYDCYIKTNLAYVGNLVKPGSKVISIIDQSKTLISISGEDLDFLVPGSEVYFLNGPQKLKSKVYSVDTINNKVLLEPEVPYEKAINTSVPVEIVYSSKHDVIAIRPSAIYTEAGRSYVYILETVDGREIKSEREIKTGINTGAQVEIVFGLDEGDVLILDMY